MLKSTSKLSVSTELSSAASVTLDINQSSGTPEPVTPGGTRPRKKLSFKEPEFFGYLKMRKPTIKVKPVGTTSPKDNRTSAPLDEEPFAEENMDYEELEVKKNSRLLITSRPLKI